MPADRSNPVPMRRSALQARIGIRYSRGGTLYRKAICSLALVPTAPHIEVTRSPAPRGHTDCDLPPERQAISRSRTAMDYDKRLQLIAGLPRPATLHEMPTGEKRAVVHDFIVQALDTLDDEQHPLNNWESLDLRSALAAYDGGMYAAAVSFVERALTPVPERHGFAGFSSTNTTTTADLRNRLATIDAGTLR
jgi:hypothetical protein